MNLPYALVSEVDDVKILWRMGIYIWYSPGCPYTDATKSIDTEYKAAMMSWGQGEGLKNFLVKKLGKFIPKSFETEKK